MATVANAQITDVISGCGQTCETSCAGKPASCKQATGSPAKCRLSADITCASTDSSIQLLNGTDFDLKGFDITCTETSPTTCNYPAISMAASGSKVTNSGAGFESVISGRFGAGIECNLTSSSIVENVTIADGIIAIDSCLTVRNNVVRGSGMVFSGANWGILDATSITDNYVQGRVAPIQSGSSSSTDVLRNVIKGTGLTAINVASASGNIKNNIVFAPDGVGALAGTVIAVPGSNTINFDGNFCDPDIVDCSNCMSGPAFRCEPYISPFVGN